MFHLNKVVPVAVDDMNDVNRNVNNFPNDLSNGVRQDTLESRVASRPVDNDVREDVSVHHPSQPVVNGSLKRRNSYLLTNELILQNLAHSGDPVRKENIAGSYAILETAVDEKEESADNNKADSELSTDRHGISDQSKEETSALPASHVSVKCEDPNQALLLYFAKLSSSSEIDDSLDLGHIKSLLKDGASVNTSDRFGQTLLHEVCRTWGIDVAEFFLEQGADINKADDYGRTPLHVAAAADYPEMIRFLLDNGANFNLTTKGEKQTPLHFAVRNEAAKSVRVFLAYGANFDVRDYKLRTPLQLAAESNSAESARILLEAGASAGTRDESGMSSLTLMVTKMPSVALRALDQFHITDRPHRKQRYYLNFLEHCDTDTTKCITCSSPLQAVVEMNCFELVMHPIFQRLLEVKWKFYGGWAWLGIFLNVLLAVTYTILGVTHPLDVSNYYFPLKKNGWRMPLEFIVVLLTLNEIRKEIKEIYQSRKESNQWIKWRKKEVKRDLEFCHPRWIQERTFIKQQIRQIKERKKAYFQDKWNFLDWLVYVMLMIVFVLHATNLVLGSERYTDAFIRIMACTLILVWVRLLKFARPFPAQGHFVVILDNILGDTVRWGFVIAMFYIPYAAAFYMMFGDHSRRPVKGYDSILSLAYTIIRYPLVDNYGFDELESAAPIMARVLCGSFLILAAIVLMNLYIALLSNTFQRVYDNARATAAMQRARLLQDLEASASSGKVARYREHIRERCSPEGSDYLVIISDEEEQNRKQEEKISMVHNIVSDRLGGKKFGKVQKSEFDTILEDIELLKRSQGEVKGVLDRFNLKLKELKSLNATLLEEIIQLKSNGQQRMLAIKEVGTSLSDLKIAMDDEFGGLKNDMEANIEKLQADAALRNVALESNICSQVKQLQSEFNEINLRHDKYEQELRTRVELLEDFILSLEVKETGPEKAVSKEKRKGVSTGLHGGTNGSPLLLTTPLSPPLLKIRPRSSNSEKIGAADKNEQIEERHQNRSITPETMPEKARDRKKSRGGTEGSQVDTTGSAVLSLPVLKTRPQSGVDAESGAIGKSKQIEERQRRRPITAEAVPGKATSKETLTGNNEGSQIDISGTKSPQFPVLKTRPQSRDGTEIGAIDKSEQIEERQRRRTITAGSKEARDQYLSKLRASLILSPNPHQDESNRESDS